MSGALPTEHITLDRTNLERLLDVAESALNEAIATRPDLDDVLRPGGRLVLDMLREVAKLCPTGDLVQGLPPSPQDQP